MIYKTPKGTELPLISLKGKDYMMCAMRLVWFNEEVQLFKIETQFIRSEDTVSIVKATITILDDKGGIVKQASATKREDQKHFPDHLEKAETGAIGRCLALLGFGTNFAVTDLEEGERLLDSPLKSNFKEPAPTKPLVNVPQVNNNPVTEKQIIRLDYICKSKNWIVDDLKKHLLEKYNLNTRAHLTQAQYQELCSFIEANPIINLSSNTFEELDVPSHF